MYYNAGKRGRYVQSVGPEEYDMLGFNADARGFVNGRIMLSEDFDFLDQGIANGADSQIVSSVASDLYGNLVYYDELTESPQRLLTGEVRLDLDEERRTGGTKDGRSGATATGRPHI